MHGPGESKKIRTFSGWSGFGFLFLGDYAGRASTLDASSEVFCKTETPTPIRMLEFLVGAGSFASRAAKNSPQGCFCAVFGDSAAAVLIHPLMFLEKFRVKQKLQYPVRILELLVGAGGFEPPKLKAADLQSVPIGHSGTRPDSFFNLADCLYILPPEL